MEEDLVWDFGEVLVGSGSGQVVSGKLLQVFPDDRSTFPLILEDFPGLETFFGSWLAELLESS